MKRKNLIQAAMTTFVTHAHSFFPSGLDFYSSDTYQNIKLKRITGAAKVKRAAKKGRKR